MIVLFLGFIGVVDFLVLELGLEAFFLSVLVKILAEPVTLVVRRTRQRACKREDSQSRESEDEFYFQDVSAAILSPFIPISILTSPTNLIECASRSLIMEASLTLYVKCMRV
jgi:hypothetical protein